MFTSDHRRKNQTVGKETAAFFCVHQGGDEGVHIQRLVVKMLLFTSLVTYLQIIIIIIYILET